MIKHKVTEITFEIDSKLYSKSFSVLTGNNYYREYNILNQMLASGKSISRSKFYSALKKARSSKVNIKTNFITKTNSK